MNDVVYHYTSPEGVLGILHEKSLHFTDAQYLNDKGELLYIKEPFEEAFRLFLQNHDESSFVLDEFMSALFESTYENAIPIVLAQDTSIGTLRYYVLCTSKNPDSSSMWSYYTKNGVYQGYNLGIHRAFFENCFANYPSQLLSLRSGEVVYEKKSQIEELYEKLEELYREFYYGDEILGKCLFLANLRSYLQKQKFFFKNPAFSSEEEYRFILIVDEHFSDDTSISRDFKLDFRLGKSGIITPFIKWTFTLDEKSELFSQITLAPMIEANLAEDSFKRFLASKVRKSVEIKQSSIQLRF